MKIKGHVDNCDGKGIGGWILDHDQPEAKLRLAVYRGATLLGTCVADRFRQDLADGGLGGGHCAFTFELAERLSLAELRALKVCVVGTQYFFPFRVGPSVIGLTPGELYERVGTELRQSGRQWRKFKTCILHIGTEKTGSTSLQSYFGGNRATFADNGYFIPLSLAPSLDNTELNHTHLAMISMNDENFDDDLRRQFHVFDRDSLNRARRDLFTSFSEEVAAAPLRCHTVMLSNEHCHSRLGTFAEVQNLKDFLDHFCETYRIVVYLRPQHELAMSQYGMFVANGTYDIDMFPPLPPPLDYDKIVYTNFAYFDYQALLDRWSQVFGKDAMHPRIYAADLLRNGDVVNDFTADLLPISEDLIPPPRRNTNTSARGQAFLAHFYRHFGDFGRFGAAMLRERVRNAVLECFPGSGPTPSRGEVAEFLDKFAAGNEAVRSRWFPQRQHLFELDLETFPETAPTITLSPEEIVGIFVEVLLGDQNLCFSLTPLALRRVMEGLPPSTE